MFNNILSSAQRFLEEKKKQLKPVVQAVQKKFQPITSSISKVFNSFKAPPVSAPLRSIPKILTPKPVIRPTPKPLFTPAPKPVYQTPKPAQVRPSFLQSAGNFVKEKIVKPIQSQSQNILKQQAQRSPTPFFTTLKSIPQEIAKKVQPYVESDKFLGGYFKPTSKVRARDFIREIPGTVIDFLSPTEEAKEGAKSYFEGKTLSKSQKKAVNIEEAFGALGMVNPVLGKGGLVKPVAKRILKGVVEKSVPIVKKEGQVFGKQIVKTGQKLFNKIEPQVEIATTKTIQKLQGDKLLTAIESRLPDIQKKAFSDPKAIEDFGVLDKVKNLLTKGKETPEDIRRATEILKFHGEDVGQKLTKPIIKPLVEGGVGRVTTPPLSPIVKNIGGGEVGEVVEKGFVKPQPLFQEARKIIKPLEKPIIESKPTLFGKTPQKFSLKKLGIKPEVPKIIRREDVLLRERIRAEARGSKAGFQVGKTITREQITDQFRTKIANMNQAKSDVVTYVKENLPISERGKFITVVKNATDQEDVAKSFFRVDRQVETFEKKQLVSTINKGMKRLLNSPSVDVRFKQVADKLLDDVDLVKRSPEKLENLRKTKQFIDSQIATGQSMEMPKRILESIEILSKKSVDDLTIRDLQALNDKLNLVENLGRFRFTSRKIEYEAEKALRLKDLLKGTQGIEKIPELKAPVGGRLNFNDQLKNRVIDIKNETQRVNMAITPMDVVFDMLDGNQRYSGPNYRIFKATLDKDFGGFLDNLSDTRVGFDKLKKQLNLNEANFERIGVHAARVQEGGIQKLIDTGLSLDDINAVKLTPQEIKIYQYMRGEMEKVKPQIDDVMREVYNQPVGKVDDYFSFMTDFKAMGESEIFQRFGGVDEFGMRTKIPEIGFTKQRTLGAQAIKLDAEDIFLQHMENVHYLTNMSRNIKMLSEIAVSPQYLKVAGDRGQKMILEWLDLMARKGGADQAKIIPFLDQLRTNVGVGILGFRLSTILIQPTALITAAAEIGGKNATEGAIKIATSRSWREFLAKNIPEYRMRGGDDPAFLEFSEHELLGNIQKVGMAGIKFADIYTSGATVAGAYIKKLAELGLPLDLLNPNREALEYANLVLRRTQSSAFFKDVPLAVSKGALTGNRSVDKALFQFQNFILNQWSYIRHDAFRLGIQDKDPVEASRKLMWIALAIIAASGTGIAAKGIISNTISAITGKVEDSDPDENKFVERLTQDALGIIPFVGPVVNSISYSSLPVPSLDVAAGTLEGVGRLLKAKTGEGRLGGAIKLAEEGGALFGIPGVSQAAQIARNIRYSVTPDEATVKQVKREKTKQKETDTERIQPIYDELQIMKQEGRKAEADKIYFALPEVDRKIYKGIKQSEKRKRIGTLKVEMYPLAKELQAMKEQGRKDEANKIYFALPADKRAAYKQAKKELGIGIEPTSQPLFAQ